LSHVTAWAFPPFAAPTPRIKLARHAGRIDGVQELARHISARIVPRTATSRHR
jgi:hypothetical protein